MTEKLTGRVALVTGASSGIGSAIAIALADQGATVALVARRKDRLDDLVSQIEGTGGSATAIQADITERPQAESVIQQVVDKCGRLDILVNNAGLMLLGPVVGADAEEWERMLAINVQGLLYTTRAALPHLLAAAGDSERQVADVVNISSVAGRTASENFAVYNLTKFGVNGFTEALRQEVTRRHVRVGVVEPGAVVTELGSHNSEKIQSQMLDPFNEAHERLEPSDIADAVTFMVTRPRRASIAEILVMPTEQAR